MGIFGRIFKPGAKRCNAHSARKPELILYRIFGLEMSPGAFDEDRLALCKLRHRSARVVTQGLDREIERSVGIDSRNRERMLLVACRAQEDEFARL